MVRALSSHQCGPGSSPGVDVICLLSLLLVLSLAPRGFSPGSPVFPSPRKPNLLLKDVRVNIIKIFSETVLTLLINFGLPLKSCSLRS